MASPADRVYSESHEWHKSEGDTLTLGLTQFAVNQLTDVTYVEMKKPGLKFKAGEIVGEVESVKTTSDVYCAVGGRDHRGQQGALGRPGPLEQRPLRQGMAGEDQGLG